MILGIDPGTTTGWAVLDPAGARESSGSWDLRHPIPGVRRGVLFLRLRAHLEELIGGIDRPVLVAVERVFQHTSEAQDRIYGGIVGMVEAVAAAWDLDVVGIAVPTAKKHATGRGIKVPKDEMLAAARKRWGKVKDHNEADALWVADAARVGLHKKAKN